MSKENSITEREVLAIARKVGNYRPNQSFPSQYEGSLENGGIEVLVDGHIPEKGRPLSPIVLAIRGRDTNWLFYRQRASQEYAQVLQIAQDCWVKSVQCRERAAIDLARGYLARIYQLKAENRYRKKHPTPIPGDWA